MLVVIAPGRCLVVGIFHASADQKHGTRLSRRHVSPKVVRLRCTGIRRHALHARINPLHLPISMDRRVIECCVIVDCAPRPALPHRIRCRCPRRACILACNRMKNTVVIRMAAFTSALPRVPIIVGRDHRELICGPIPPITQLEHARMFIIPIGEKQAVARKPHTGAGILWPKRYLRGQGADEHR